MQDNIYVHLEKIIKEEIQDQLTVDPSSKSKNINEVSSDDITKILGGFGGAASEVFKEFIAAQLLEAFGVKSDSFLGKFVVQGVGELTLDELKDFIYQEDYDTCLKFVRGGLRALTGVAMDELKVAVLKQLEIMPADYNPGTTKINQDAFMQGLYSTFATALEDSLQDFLTSGDLGYAIADGLCQLDFKQIQDKVSERFLG